MDVENIRNPSMTQKFARIAHGTSADKRPYSVISSSRDCTACRYVKLLTYYELNFPRAGARCMARKCTRNSSVDEIGERYGKNSYYRLNDAVVVELYHHYTQFPRNVRISHL